MEDSLSKIKEQNKALSKEVASLKEKINAQELLEVELRTRS
jgi:hypothetical protein